MDINLTLRVSDLLSCSNANDNLVNVSINILFTNGTINQELSVHHQLFSF